MKIVPRRSDPRPEHAHHVCNMCGKPSEITISTSARSAFAWKPSLERNRKSRVTPGLTGNRLAPLEHCCGIVEPTLGGPGVNGSACHRAVHG
jgi:hypothetical protein